ncbi:2-C-methyl-D-erythritol 4-phosphate cytidylyltransferase [Mucilaginibacter conchicola]|uniref:2-C-methyl-D-erythritol 4-phosphate cytidylyltransferase n=1 Tax=Mucilaginibacter conchicola TaxID=2303333 RepID=A0A372NY01_9SPHI|nr:2-C-methyl-D-erythritol 4-phosphate cytidylyltransferase [Mucilaginibacter conchicola]RFZ94998.1 2-C-methyl-D-erythritol 4-phosphate cytidylyltransferase [Mucilaginibacter conchicola]
MPNLQSLTSNLSNKNYAIIVAGGSGSRMQSVLPKQFIELCGEPVLMHTIRAFSKSDAAPQIILALNGSYHELWAELREKHNFNIQHTVIAGGETRFHSVKNALDTITDTNAIVAVHDAVRPLTSKQTIDESYLVASTTGTAVTAVKSRDSIRQLNGEVSICLDREGIYLVQTPQTFEASLLKQAYEQPYTNMFTDDASVVEKAGAHITLIEGSHSNIKITFPEDIIIAEALLNKKAISGS